MFKFTPKLVGLQLEVKSRNSNLSLAASSAAQPGCKVRGIHTITGPPEWAIIQHRGGDSLEIHTVMAPMCVCLTKILKKPACYACLANVVNVFVTCMFQKLILDKI